VAVAGLLASIPSPNSGVLELGPFEVRAYGLLIALGVVAAVALTRRRWIARGGDPDVISTLAVWCVPAGLVGARLYHVATDYQLYEGRWLDAFKVWDGGLGVWGAIGGGTIAGLVVAHVKGWDKLALMDAAAPGLALAQAIGRWGNWFNQELFGRPTDLPWGLEIDFANRPAGYERFETFHPTFLYESLWCLAIVGLLLLVERRFRLRPGRLFALYVAAYTFARFWIEGLRIDPANKIAGLRVNEWVSLLLFAAAMASFFWPSRGKPEPEPEASALVTGAEPGGAAADDAPLERDPVAGTDRSGEP